MKKTIFTACISALIGFSLCINIANSIIPLFWDRRLIVKLGLISAGTIILSALAYLTIIRLIFPFFNRLTKNQRIIYLFLIGGGVTAIQYFLPPPLPKMHHTFEIQILPGNQDTSQKNMPSIMEIRDINGNKVPLGSLELNDGWTQVNGILTPKAGKTASLKYHFIGESGKQIHVLFSITAQLKPIFVRSNGIEAVYNFPQNLVFANEEFSEGFVVKANPAIGEPLNWIVLSFFNLFSMGLLNSVLFMGLALILPDREIYLNKYPWIPLVPIAILAILMFWSGKFPGAPDSEYYLSLAKNLYYGRGYVDPNLMPFLYRGPVFPLLITFSYIIFGESFRSALILERIFWVLTIFVCYMVAKRIYNPRVGFLAALLVITTSEINNTFNRVWTDGILVFVILVLLLVMWEVFINEHGVKMYVLMGFLMGTAYLLKQTSILIIPLPLLMWAILAEYRTRKIFMKLLLCYSIFAFFLFGWMGYIYLAGGSPGQVAGDFQKGLDVLSYFNVSSSLKTARSVPPSLLESIKSQIVSIFKMVRTFYTNDIANYFKIAFIFPIALLYTSYQAVLRKTKPDIFLVLSLILFTLLIPIQAYADFGFRHNLYFYIIVLILIAAMFDRIFNIIPLSKTYKDLLVFFVASYLVFLQLSGGIEINLFTGQKINEQTSIYFNGASYRGTAAWVDAHIKPDEKILIYLQNGNILHILTKGNRTFDDINTCIGEISFVPARRCSPPYITFWINKGTTDPDNPRDSMSGISETVLITTIREKDVKYVIVTPKIYYLYYYLKAHPDFKKIAQFGNAVIFRVVHPVQSISNYPNVKWETCVGKGTSEYLKHLHKMYPVRYEMMLRNHFEPWMGLTRQDMNAFENWQGCEFESNYPGTYNLP